LIKEITLYCDESEIKGQFFSNFYGGALIKSIHANEIQRVLKDKKIQLNLHGEVKWQKVTGNYLDKYIDLMGTFFNFIKEDKIKVRIMFSQNCNVAEGLEPYHIEHEYFILYYHFIKHAFGLQYANNSSNILNVRAYFDKLPDTKEKCELFKDHIHGLNRYIEFKKGKISIDREQITEVVSHKHDILQCLDIILGAVQFRLNDKHKEIPNGSRTRGKRTIAKEKLYKFINSKIREIYPSFNIGISTGLKGDIKNRWQHPYRHWLFVPKNASFRENSTKKK